MELILYEKVKVWRRTYVNVDTEDEDIAVRKCLNGEYDVTDSTYIYETEELVDDPKHKSVEITTLDDQVLYNNG